MKLTRLAPPFLNPSPSVAAIEDTDIVVRGHLLQYEDKDTVARGHISQCEDTQDILTYSQHLHTHSILARSYKQAAP